MRILAGSCGFRVPVRVIRLKPQLRLTESGIRRVRNKREGDSRCRCCRCLQVLIFPIERCTICLTWKLMV